MIDRGVNKNKAITVAVRELLCFVEEMEAGKIDYKN